MNESMIVCPNCQHELKLTESIAAPLIQQTRTQFEQRLALKDQEIQKREAVVREQLQNVERAKASVADEVEERLQTERERISDEALKKARLALGADLAQRAKEVSELQQIVADKDTKLSEAQKVQSELMKKQRELDDARRELDITVEKKVQESLVIVRHKAKQEAENSLKLKVTEKEEQIASMQRQIEELRKKAEQGSQQLQGEAFEIELEAVIRAKFPRDIIEAVPKGEFGGDILHRVVGPSGQICGTILWESKRTKNWSDSWLPKLREDQRAAKAEIALIVSNVLPKAVEAFDQIDGVWVTEPRCMVPVALALRQTLIELAGARQATEGQQTKMELVYQYLTGPRFRHRIEAIVERFSDMQTDLERERKAATRLWAKREEQIRGVIEATVGMYGDLQGIAGRALQEIESLDILAIESAPQSKE
jgi:hypothetical protein